ncbi:hypothetical protein QAD02_008576 [Eretmocerus hayati]|uniref:Uncharacterized protein n=1 Tax=Eretmocerus hayati TaxID=131215 RepID=A0ACC2N781_9HYME|nr:hypothetical protein QAD02_008576 [Eretmocerus hayati]
MPSAVPMQSSTAVAGDSELALRSEVDPSVSRAFAYRSLCEIRSDTFASDLEPFLKEFQSNEPKLPYMYNALKKMILNVMRRVVKVDQMSKFSKYLWKLNLDNDDVLLTSEKVKLGYATIDALALVEDGPNKLFFKNDCRTILISFLKYYLQKCPLKNDILRGVSCFDPLVAYDQPLAESRLSLALTKLVRLKTVASSKAEFIEREFSELLSLSSTKNELKLAVKTKPRLDSFWMKLIANHGESNYSNLIYLLKKVFILSHGNAALERGFSVNKECLADNQTEGSLVARRIICDTINATEKDAHEYIIDKDLINDVKSSSSRYKSDLAKKQKNKEENDERVKKEKAKATQIRDVQQEIQKTTNEYLQKTATLESKLCLLKKT